MPKLSIQQSVLYVSLKSQIRNKRVSLKEWYSQVESTPIGSLEEIIAKMMYTVNSNELDDLEAQFKELETYKHKS